MTRGRITILLCFLIPLLAGCIHTYPDPLEGNDPTLLNVSLEISANKEWAATNVYGSKAARDPAHRIIVEILRDYSTVAHKEMILPPETDLSQPFRLPFSFQLDPRRYEIAIWCDCLDPADNTPSGYDASSLSDIKAMKDPQGWTVHKDCFFHLGILDLREHSREESKSVTVPVSLERPLGGFRLIADDYQEFINVNEGAIRKGESYSVEISIQPGLARGFDLLDRSPLRRKESDKISCPVRITTIPGIEMELASAYPFCGDETVDFTIDVFVFNSAKALISKTQGISFPMRKGALTTIRGRLLTNYINGGITVDPTWDGEIDIEI